MELTAAAAWLNTTFAGFDSVLLGAQHLMAEKLGTVLTPLISEFIRVMMSPCFSEVKKEWGICCR